MKKKRIIILFLMLSLCFATYASAETIILKSGKTIKGSIIERTDEYIKVDFGGLPITYYSDDIESIDGATIVLSKNSNENDTSEWQEWLRSNSIGDYLDTIKTFLQKGEMITEQAGLDLREVIKKDNKEAALRVAEENSNNIALLIDEIRAIMPPKGLEKHHEKVIQIFEYRKQINDALMRGDREAFAENTLASITAEMQEMEELRYVSASKGAPEEVLAEHDAIIADYKSHLDRISNSR